MRSPKLLPRQKVPTALEAHLLFEADHTCCICHEKGNDVQIHHISGRHRSTDDNLIVVCVNFHSRIERKGGLGKKFTPAELKRYKAQWTGEVKRRRKANMLLDREFATVVELEVRKLSYAFESLRIDSNNEGRAAEILSVMHCYARDFGPRVKNECLSSIYGSCNWLRRRATTQILVNLQTIIVFETLPTGFGGLRAPGRPINRANRDLLSHAINVAGEICYDTCKYVRKKEIAEPAVQLLADILRFTCLNKLEKEKANILHEFDECTRVSETPFFGAAFEAGVNLLKEWKTWALDF